MFVPKKLKHNSLIEFKQYLERETNEKIVKYNGWQLITESAVYTIVDSKVLVNSLDILKKVDDNIQKLGNRPKPPKKKKVAETKPKSKKDILAEMRERGKKVLDKKKKK